MLEDKIQNPRKVPVPVLPRRLCYGSKKWRWSSRWTISSHHAQFKVILISRILRCWTRRIASALNKIIQKFPLQKESQSRGTESSERRSVSTRNTDRLHDLRVLSRVTGAHDNVLNYADLLSIILRNDDVQEFDTRWDGVYLRQSFHPMMSWKVCTS